MVGLFWTIPLIPFPHPPPLPGWWWGGGDGDPWSWEASPMQFKNCEHDVRETLFDLIWFDTMIINDLASLSICLPLILLRYLFTIKFNMLKYDLTVKRSGHILRLRAWLSETNFRHFSSSHKKMMLPLVKSTMIFWSTDTFCLEKLFISKQEVHMCSKDGSAHRLRTWLHKNTNIL